MMPEGRRKPSLAVASSSRLTQNTYLDRIDPLHEISWHDAQAIQWQDISVVQHVLRASPSGAIVHRDRLHWSAIDVSPARQYHPASIRVVAVLSQFHQLSTLQISAYLDVPVRTAWRALSSLFDAGVLTRAVPRWWDDNDDRNFGGTGSIWSIDVRSPQVEKWLDGLSDLEFMLLAGGRDITQSTPGQASSTAIRHNLTLSELTLRAAEMCPGAIGVWGEPHATADLMYDSSDQKIRSNIADGIIVGKDGRMILIETSGRSNLDDGKSGKQIQAKAAAWAAIAARSDLDLRVIFVDISQNGRHKRFRWHVLEGMRNADAHLTRRRDVERAQERVFTVDAKRDWFPAELMVTEGFTRLEAYDPMRERYHDLLPADLAIDPESDVVVNTLASIHTPAWITRTAASLAVSA